MRPPMALAMLNSPAVAVLGSFLLMIIKRLFLRSDIIILSSCDSGVGCFVGSIILPGGGASPNDASYARNVV